MAMTAPVHPAPPPWRWQRDHDTVIGPGHPLFGEGKVIRGAWRLLDANGRPLVDQGMVFHLDDKPELRELLRAAPEMQTALQAANDLLRWLTPFAFAYATEHPECNMPTQVAVDDAVRTADALLGRLDEARKAGG